MRKILLGGISLMLAFCAAAGPLDPPLIPKALPGPWRSGVNPPQHLRNAIAKVESGGTVQGCIAGDSTSLGTASPANPYEGIENVVRNVFQRQNPGVAFAWQNFAIPGTTLPSFFTNQQAKAQSYGLSWYSSGALWQQFVGLAGCDILVTNWGVNDGAGPIQKALRQLVTTVAGYTTHPDLVMLTGWVANPAAGLPFSQSDYQAGYIANPAMVEAFAAAGTDLYNSGLITTPVPAPGVVNIGRLAQQAVYGKDYYNQYSRKGMSLIPSTTISLSNGTLYQLPPTDGDFSIKVAFTGQYTSMQTNSAQWQISVGASNGGTGTSGGAVVVVSPVPGGANIQYIYDATEISKLYVRAFSGMTYLQVEVAVKGSFLTVFVNGFEIIRRHVPKPTAPFTPEIKYTISNGVTSTMTIQDYSYGIARPIWKTLTTQQAYGPTVGTAATNGATAAGDNQLTFDSAAVPAVAAVGVPLANNTTPSAIPTGTTIQSISTAGGITTVTMSANAAGVGVASGDSISFGDQTSDIGGSGVNHEASPGLNWVNAAALQMTDFCLVCYTRNRSALPARTVSAPNSGATITATDDLTTLIVDPAADIAAATIVLPSRPRDGQAFEAVCTKTVTALTVSASASPSGQSVGAPTNPMTCNAGTRREFRYRESSKVWLQAA